MSCCCSSVGDAVERQFSQKKAAKELARYRAKGPEPTTRLLLAGLTKAGPLHGRLLDVGSGIGALTFELLEPGLTSAVGVDLSSAHVETASKEASRRSQSDSTRSGRVLLSGIRGAARRVAAPRGRLFRFLVSKGPLVRSGGGLDSKTWVDRSLGIRFDHSSIPCRPWSK